MSFLLAISCITKIVNEIHKRNMPVLHGIVRNDDYEYPFISDFSKTNTN